MWWWFEGHPAHPANLYLQVYDDNMFHWNFLHIWKSVLISGWFKGSSNTHTARQGNTICWIINIHLLVISFRYNLIPLLATFMDRIRANKVLTAGSQHYSPLEVRGEILVTPTAHITHNQAEIYLPALTDCLIFKCPRASADGFIKDSFSCQEQGA